MADNITMSTQEKYEREKMKNIVGDLAATNKNRGKK